MICISGKYFESLKNVWHIKRKVGISGKIGDEVSPPFPGACLHRCGLIVEHTHDNHNNQTDFTKQNMNKNHKNTGGNKISPGRPLQ